MNFLVTSSHTDPSPMLVLSADRLVLRATKESREREIAEEARRLEEVEKRKKRKRSGRKRNRSPEDAFAEAAAAASRHSLKISGALLRSLCLTEAGESCKPAVAEVWATETDNLACVVLYTSPQHTLQTGLRVVAASDMADYLFDVQTELLVRGRLVVFTSWDNLSQVAVQPRLGHPPQQRLLASVLFQQQQQQQHQQQQLEGEEAIVQVEHEDATDADGSALAQPPPELGDGAEATAAAPPAHGGPAGKPPPPTRPLSTTGRLTLMEDGEPGSVATTAATAAAAKTESTTPQTLAASGKSTPSMPNAPTTPGSSVGSGSAVAARMNKYQRQEPVLDVVPAPTTSDDIKDLNELMERGVVSAESAGKELTAFLCCRCGKLPIVTLTMVCCGALLCPRCLPTPPTVEGAPREERLCPVCQEEPLQPPQTHPPRDALLAQLVKELKVLYYPQLRALRQRPSQGEVKRSPDIKAGGTNYPSSLGLL